MIKINVTGNIEGVCKVKKKGSLILLFEQELFDCNKVDEGCNREFITVDYERIIKMNRVKSEQDYKYEEKQHSQCQLNKTKLNVNNDGY
ncbi:unnamed protein product [Rotaria sp. Silwood2]|nr:unnamed protein product [Rotaria sp. Silwood2]CAF4497322.1 unnamed protein product [Rotaria sp. Silwood2]